MARFSFNGRHVADWLEEPAVVKSVDPFKRGILDGLGAAPRPAPMDHLGLEQAADGLGKGIVIAVSDTADGGLDACLGKAFGVADRDILHAALRVLDETAPLNRPALAGGLFKGIQHEIGPRGAGHTPTDDAPAKTSINEGQCPRR